MFDGVSNQTRNEVWQGYLDAERLNRYYYRLANKYNKIYYTVKIMIAFAAVGGLTRLFGILPDKWISVADVATVIVLVLVILDLVQDYGKKLAVLNRVSKDSQLQLQEWKMLWNLVDKPGSKDEDVLKQMNILNKNAAKSGAEVTNAGLGENKKFNQTAWEEANEVLSEAFTLASFSDGLCGEHLTFGIKAHGIRCIRFQFHHNGPSMLATSAPFQPWTEIRPRWNRRGCDYQVIGR